MANGRADSCMCIASFHVLWLYPFSRTLLYELYSKNTSYWTSTTTIPVPVVRRRRCFLPPLLLARAFLLGSRLLGQGHGMVAAQTMQHLAIMARAKLHVRARDEITEPTLGIAVVAMRVAPLKLPRAYDETLVVVAHATTTTRAGQRTSHLERFLLRTPHRIHRAVNNLGFF